MSVEWPPPKKILATPFLRDLGSRPDSVGGEVVAENFRDLHKRTRFAGGEVGA